MSERRGPVAEPPMARTATGPATQHRPWSTVLLVFHTVGVVCAAAVIAGSVALFVVTAAAPAPEGDGINEPYGLVIAPILALVGMVILGLAHLLRRLTVRGRREADDGQPRLLRRCAAASMALGTLATLMALAVVWSARDTRVISLVLVIGGLYLASAVLTTLTAGRIRAARASGTAAE